METLSQIGRSEPLRLFRTHFTAMGGTCEIAVGGSLDRRLATEAMEHAAREVLRIERKYSRYRYDEDSIVFRINQGAGAEAPVACDPETMDLLRTAANLHRLSDGLFDITSGVLRRAWDFRKPVLPHRDEVKALLKLIGFGRVEIGEASVRLPMQGMEIDFGGIGKEYAADRAAGVLASRGVRHGYVNLGGDIRVVGPQPDGKPWLFGVADPRRKGSVIANVEVASGGLSTSGDYEKYFEINSVRYCHIINPVTGVPVNCWRSVSVTGVSSLAAGAMSTIAMLKESGAVAFLEKMQCNYLLVDAEGRMITSSKNQHAGDAACRPA